MASSYPKGELVVCRGEFHLTNPDGSQGALADPTAPLFAYCDGGGTWHRGLTPTKTGTGVYTYSVDTNTPGTLLGQEKWWYAFYAPSGDSLQAADQASFFVDNRGRF
jgi:hypothetical protein